MEINRERLWERIQSLHQIGTTQAGGVSRFSFTPEERAVKDQVADWMREAGLSVREDAAGNLIGRREGSAEDAPVVLVGSHLDSVPNGGDFDGPLGVLAALEAVALMEVEGVTTEHPIEVVAFTDEEGARFRFGMIGSRALAGTLTVEHLDLHHDPNDITIRDAFLTAGLNPARIADATRNPDSVKGYIELHIEQGKILEEQNQPVGIVTGIAGPLWVKLTLQGEAGHAGTTPMRGRKDALVAAAEVISAVERETRRRQRTVGTVGQLELKPGGVNIIPGTVELTLDLRDVDEHIRDEVEWSILTEARLICEQRGISLEVQTLQRVSPVLCNEELQAVMADAAAELELDTPSLVSGAGHDGMQFADKWPVGMLFVRSRNGVSHHPEEYTSKDDCAVAANVLLGTLLRFAN